MKSRLFPLNTRSAQRCINLLCVCVLYFQKEKEDSVKSLSQQNVDSDIWVPDYLTPSWVCLPNNQPVLAIVPPGETTLEVLCAVCKVSHEKQNLTLQETVCCKLTSEHLMHYKDIFKPNKFTGNGLGWFHKALHIIVLLLSTFSWGLIHKFHHW